MNEAQNSLDMSTSLLRLAELGRKFPQRCFTNLNQYLTVNLLRAAFYKTRKDGSVGVDGQTAIDYAQALEANLESLLQRAKDGSYHAPPVKRGYIPKGNGHRAIGIPSFEDKVLQRAVVMILEKLYEPLFHPFSFGYRPGKSAHQALDTLRQLINQTGGGYVIELDIQAFFDNLDKSILRGFLQQRIGDGVILRLINKWLKAGVMEHGQIHYPIKGSIQGGVISPVLANVYLHYVLDQWFEEQVAPRLISKASLIRYADDGLLIMRNDKDITRVMEVLPKRFNRFGLQLHPEKTRCTVFKPGKKTSIDFLGFTHYWKIGRKKWDIARKTMKSRFARGVKAIKDWCRYNRHKPLPEQYKMLCQKVRGHYAYYGMSGNLLALKRFRYCVERIWVKWLRRRSQKHRLQWDKARLLLDRYYLPTARIMTTKPASMMI